MKSLHFRSVGAVAGYVVSVPRRVRTLNNRFRAWRSDSRTFDSLGIEKAAYKVYSIKTKEPAVSKKLRSHLLNAFGYQQTIDSFFSKQNLTNQDLLKTIRNLFKEINYARKEAKAQYVQLSDYKLAKLERDIYAYALKQGLKTMNRMKKENLSLPHFLRSDIDYCAGMIDLAVVGKSGKFVAVPIISLKKAESA